MWRVGLAFLPVRTFVELLEVGRQECLFYAFNKACGRFPSVTITTLLSSLCVAPQDATGQTQTFRGVSVRVQLA